MGRDHFPNIPIGAGMGFARGVMLLDDCEGTMTWTVTGTGGDDVHLFATAAAWQGTYGMHLKSRTTAAAENDTVGVLKMFDYPGSGLLVARLRVCPVAVAAIKSINVHFRIDDGAQQYAAYFRLAISTGKVYYTDAAGNWIEIATMATTFTGGNWYTIELSIDCLAHKWLAARFNGFEYDASALPLYNDAATAGRFSLLGCYIIATDAPPAEIYADNIYVGEYLES
jgi:hypothetical protein